MEKTIITAGSFDDIRAKHVRFLYEIAQLGEVTVMLFGDELHEKITGAKPKFPVAERQYYAENIRYVESVVVVDDVSQMHDIAGLIGKKADMRCDLESYACPKAEKSSQDQGIEYKTIADDDMMNYPDPAINETINSGKKVIVTGCFDWFHTGHVRFLEETSEYGDLYVVVGHDKNLEALKGPGHPMFKEDERRFLVGSIKFVKQCLISSGDGWMDAEPEIDQIKPDIYAVNEDGDKEAKQNFCKEHGLEYLVLKREPKEGLTRRTSTNLRGF
jgi:cytidyltransferase-like protein